MYTWSRGEYVTSKPRAVASRAHYSGARGLLHHVFTKTERRTY